MDRADFDQGLAGIRPALLVATMPPVAADPSMGALDDPAPLNDLEAFFRGVFAGNLYSIISVLVHPSGKAAFAVGIIAQYLLNSGIVLGP
jgi:hypothetical protein